MLISEQGLHVSLPDVFDYNHLLKGWAVGASSHRMDLSGATDSTRDWFDFLAFNSNIENFCGAYVNIRIVFRGLKLNFLSQSLLS